MIAVMTLLFVLVISCAAEETPDTGTVGNVERDPTPTPVITNENGITRVVVNLSPTDGEGQFGTATFVSDANTTTIEISVSPSSDAAQPIHIHSGVCTDVGPVLHSLQNVVKGSSITLIDSALTEIITHGALVNVHASYADASNYTACGQLPDELVASD